MDQTVAMLLERHRTRRSAGIPTLTAMIGPVGVAVQEWRRTHAGRPEVLIKNTMTLTKLAEEWLSAALAAGALDRALVERTAKALDVLPIALERRLTDGTEHDVERLLDRMGVADGVLSLVSKCLWKRQQPPQPVPIIAQSLVAALVGNSRPIETSLAELAEMMATSAPAILHLATCDPSETSISSLCDLVAAAPSIPIAIAIPADIAETILRQTARNRWLTMLHEGVVRFEGPKRESIVERLSSSRIAADSLAETIDVLVSGGVAEEAVDDFIAAATAAQTVADAADEDRARSSAERFLFWMLESLPQTVGLFHLNHRFDFAHGHSAAESDLVAPVQKLVVEIDGSYYHLGSKDAYRRDRRKDWLLQRHGYLVLRFLAEDVVSRLEEILTTILAALELPPSDPEGH